MDDMKDKNSIAQPPEPDIAIRTMASDLKTLKTSGGQFITATEVIDGAERVSDESNGKEFILKSTLERRPLNIQKPKTESPWSTRKTLFSIVIVTLIVFGAGLLGYFVVFAWLFK